MEFGNWALTEDSSEAYRATYVLLVSAILLPVILFARRGCMTVALVLLLASIVHQVSRLHVDTSYWGHIAAGVGLCRASHYILHGDGGALVIRVQHASLGLIATLAMFSYVIFRLPLHTFYNKVHATIWALASLLFASMAAHPITARACNGALPRVAAARQLHDPAVLAALGTLLYTHLHDMQPIGMLFHQAPLVFLVLEGGGARPRSTRLPHFVCRVWVCGVARTACPYAPPLCVCVEKLTLLPYVTPAGQVFGVQLGAISVMMLASSAVHAVCRVCLASRRYLHWTENEGREPQHARPCRGSRRSARSCAGCTPFGGSSPACGPCTWRPSCTCSRASGVCSTLWLWAISPMDDEGVIEDQVTW